MSSITKRLLSATVKTISTPWELTNATFNGGSYSKLYAGNLETLPAGLFFKDDGTKLYIIGSSTDSIYEFSLSTAWYVTTATYVQSKSISLQDTNPTGLYFKSDGVKMYVCGNQNDNVYEYTLSTAWDISTATYIQSFSISSQDTALQAISFKADGTKLFALGSSSDSVHEYSLSTAWDISTASFTQSKSVSTEETSPTGLDFKPDGTKMYIAGSSGRDVNEYTLSTAWDISSASYVQNIYLGNAENNPQELYFKPDGTKLFMTGFSSIGAVGFDLSTAWDISTAVYDAPDLNYLSIFNQDLVPTSIFIGNNGSKLYVLGSLNDNVYEYTLSSAWVIETASYIQSFSVSSQDINPSGLFFNSDGTSMYMIGITSDLINQYDLGTAWDISTASFSSSISTQDASSSGIAFSSDGTKMFEVGYGSDNVYESSLSTPWLISSASFTTALSVSTQDLVPTDLAFKPDGTKMYILGDGNDSVYEYTLSTAWDISTATYIQSFNISTEDTNPQGIFLSDDGTKLYVAGNSSTAIWVYDL